MSTDCYGETGTGSDRVLLTCIRGDSTGLKVRLWGDKEKTIPSDLTEATVRAQVRAHPDASEVEAEFHITVTGNEVAMSLLPTETAVLPQSSVWDLEVDWDSSGTSIQTVVSGTLRVGMDVTRVGS